MTLQLFSSHVKCVDLHSEDSLADTISRQDRMPRQERESDVIETFSSSADLPEVTQWKVHSRRSHYENKWVSVHILDVEPPDGADRYEHHVIVVPYRAVGVVVHHLEKGVLLLYRSRFITDTVGFELPAGGVEPGESSSEAAAREVLEETGWTVTEPRIFLTANASAGVSDQKVDFAYARAIESVGEPKDAFESDRLYWVPVDQVLSLIKEGLVPDSGTMTGLMYAYAFGYLNG